jgi:hypothetical protein
MLQPNMGHKNKRGSMRLAISLRDKMAATLLLTVRMVIVFSSCFPRSDLTFFSDLRWFGCVKGRPSLAQADAVCALYR